jgi:hypothetical protein
MDSILTSIKKLLGPSEEQTEYDSDIIIYINSAFASLKRLGVGPVTGFSISDKSTTWTDYLGPDIKPGDIQSYIYLKVRLIFDPPSSSPLIDAIEHQIKELEFQLQVDFDPIETVIS